MLLVVTVAFAVNAPAFVSQVRHSGFNADDWFLQATARYGSGIFGPHKVAEHPGLFGAFGALRPLFADRPAALLYYAPANALFGTHMKAYMVVSGLLPVLLAALVFVLLRRYVAGVHAFAISVLVSLFPYSDATRFWSSGSESLLSVLLFLGGLILALNGLQAERNATRRRALFLLGASLALYVLSVLTNQITIGLVVAAGLLYLRETTWRNALRVWIVDSAVCILLVAHFAQFSDKPKVTPDISRIKFIYGQGLYVVSAALDPFKGAESRTPVLVLLAIIAVAAATCLYLSKGDALRGNLARWLAVAGAAAVWIIFAWAPLLPTLGYDPRSMQGANRINIAAGIGTVVLAYAVVMLAVYVVGRPRPALALGLVAAAVIGYGYEKATVSDGQAWIGAFHEQEKVLTVVAHDAGHPPPDSTVFIAGSPFQYEGIDVFAAPFEIEGAIKIQLHNPTVSGVLVLGPGSIPCGSSNIGSGVPYGSAYLVNVANGGSVKLTSAAVCALADKTLA